MKCFLCWFIRAMILEIVADKKNTYLMTKFDKHILAMVSICIRYETKESILLLKLLNKESISLSLYSV